MKPFGIDHIEEIDRLEIARRSLNNLLTSYADEADVFTEIIQNSYDALLIAKEEGLYEKEQPKLRIVLGRRSKGHHYLFVQDNGIGMNGFVAQKLTVPGFSYGKSRGQTIGYKGVGASYFFAASQCASINTNSTLGENTQYTIRGSFDWIKNEEEPEPQIDNHCFTPNYLKQFINEERGSAVFFQFHDGMKPSHLNNIVIVGNGVENEIKNWMCYLAVKTSLGTVDNKLDNLEIEFHLDTGDFQHMEKWNHGDFNLDNKSIGYPFPQKVFKVGKEKEIIDNTPPHHLYKHERKHQAIFHRWSAEDLIAQTNTLEENEIEALREYLVWGEGYFCYSTDVFKEINKRLGGRRNIIRYGIRIACDGTPQGRMVDLSLTSSQGLDRQTHIVLAFRNLELDTGRKISADERIANAISKLGNKIVSILKEYRWAMKKKDRPDPTSDIDGWRTDIESRSQSSIVDEYFNRLNLHPAFKVDPDNESEVISLFTSLIAQKQLLGYKVLAISGFNRYDSLIDIDFSDDPCHDHKNALAIVDNDLNIEGEGKVLEFKFNFDNLIEDFQEKRKNPSEIDMVVCWNIADLNVSRGRIDPTYGNWKHHRTIYGGSYIWYDENETSCIPVIALKNLICEILHQKEIDINEPGTGSALLKRLEDNDKAKLV